jgi:hypothetical protein
MHNIITAQSKEEKRAAKAVCVHSLPPSPYLSHMHNQELRLGSNGKVFRITGIGTTITWHAFKLGQRNTCRNLLCLYQLLLLPFKVLLLVPMKLLIVLPLLKLADQPDIIAPLYVSIKVVFFFAYSRT